MSCPVKDKVKVRWEEKGKSFDKKTVQCESWKETQRHKTTTKTRERKEEEKKIRRSKISDKWVRREKSVYKKFRRRRRRKKIK